MGINSAFYDFKELDSRQSSNVKLSLLYLIMDYLKKLGLSNTCNELSKEANLKMQFEISDNVDLDIILREFQSFHYLKFKRDAKILKIIPDNEHFISSQHRNKKTDKKVIRNIQEKSSEKHEINDLKFDVKSLNLITDEKRRAPVCQIFKPLAEEGNNFPDSLNLNEILKRPKAHLTWEDCIGLDSQIESLKEAVIYPMKFPKIFDKILSGWKGIMLYGPPGCGKTYLAKVLAAETNMTFFNITSSSIISKWRGESEKLLKMMFDSAKLNAPSIIFIDELDALAPHRDSAIQHEASKRFQSELLINMDGILDKCDDIFILATTNLPWEIDVATLRRFEKRILVDIPDEKNRIDLFQQFLNTTSFSAKNYECFAKHSLNFSVSDIKSASKEFKMSLFRQNIGDLSQTENYEQIWKTLKVNGDDFLTILCNTKPTVPVKMLKKYHTWMIDDGSC